MEFAIAKITFQYEAICGPFFSFNESVNLEEKRKKASLLPNKLKTQKNTIYRRETE